MVRGLTGNKLLYDHHSQNAKSQSKHGIAPPQLDATLLNTALKANLNSLLPSRMADREMALSKLKELSRFPWV